MPTIMYSMDEIVGPALDFARLVSKEIIKLSDLTATPLEPGESPDTRRHKIAKLGKKLAEAFTTIDDFMNNMHEQLKQHERGAEPIPPATDESKAN